MPGEARRDSFQPTLPTKGFPTGNPTPVETTINAISTEHVLRIQIVSTSGLVVLTSPPYSTYHADILRSSQCCGETTTYQQDPWASQMGCLPQRQGDHKYDRYDQPGRHKKASSTAAHQHSLANVGYQPSTVPMEPRVPSSTRDSQASMDSHATQSIFAEPPLAFPANVIHTVGENSTT